MLALKLNKLELRIAYLIQIVTPCLQSFYLGLILDRLAGGGPPVPLDPSDDAGIEKAARTFVNLPVPPAPLETACEDQKSTFFHLLFSVTPSSPGNATVD